METIMMNYNNHMYNNNDNNNKQTQTDKDYTELIKEIETHLYHKDSNYHYTLTQYGSIEIDKIPMEILIFRPTHYNRLYMFNISPSTLLYDAEDEVDNYDDNVTIYVSKHFSNVKDLLNNMEEVIRTYTFIDCFLFSPNLKKKVFLQRSFLFSFSKQHDCCVCKNPTIEYTSNCKHSICLQCRFKCLSLGNNICPVCRDGDLTKYPNEIRPIIKVHWPNK
jgi:hypothetical protein